MMFRVLFLLAMSIVQSSACLAQELSTQVQADMSKPWSLRQCIDYAIAHNISVRQMQDEREQQAIQLSTHKNSRLPDLNASAAENVSFGRGLTAQNTYENHTTSSTSFSIGTSVSLFDGNKTTNNIKLSKLNLDAADADLDKARNDLSMNVAKSYIEVLNDMEIIDVAQRQISIDSMQVERLRMMVANGKASNAELSQQKATLAQSYLTLTTAKNNYQLALLDLSQLLELPSPQGFSIVRLNASSIRPDEWIPASPTVVLAEAMACKPEIKAQQLRLEGTDYSIKIAKSALYPQLSFNAGLGSNYYKTSGFDADGFGKQLKNNFSQYLGVNLSIPIFNRFATRNSIRSAQISRHTQQLKLEDTKKSLYKEIQQVYYNALAAESKYVSSQQALQSQEDAFQLTQGKYENGKANITEFNEAKNNLLKSQSDVVQAKYESLYQNSLLNFYRGKSLDFSL